MTAEEVCERMHEYARTYKGDGEESKWGRWRERVFDNSMATSPRCIVP